MNKIGFSDKRQVLLWGAFALFCVLTFCLMFQRQPFFDEAHAWMVSKSFSFFELFEIEKYEGHLFIWHTVLMPFSKNDFFYPFSMYIINWLFCAAAMFVFVKKAPFTVLEKILFMFSFPIFQYFAPVARCYSIGLFFLFLTLSLWKEKFKHPILISTLLILLANTSAMALIGAFALGLIFIYGLIKNKIFKPAPFLILAIGAILVLIQLSGSSHPNVDTLAGQHVFLLNLIVYFFLFDFKNGFDIFYILNKLTAFMILVLYIFSIPYFYKKKEGAFFFFTTFILMFLLFIFKYSGAWWHYLFFYIYLISSIWLCFIEEDKKGRIEKVFRGILVFLMVLFCVTTIFFKSAFKSEVYLSRTEDISKTIKENNLFNDGSKIYALDLFSQTANGILPYFKDTAMYNVFGDKKYSKEEYKNYLKPQDKEFLIDALAESFSENKENIGISDRKMYKIYEGYKYLIFLKPVFENKDPVFQIYEMKKVKKP